MNERQPDRERATVIVPARPGPLIRLQDAILSRDEIDDALDDLFGEPDDRGPGPVDAVLVAGGVGAIIAAQAASLPTMVTVGGAIAVTLGAVLPLRSLARRVTAARRARRLRSLLGEGALLRADHPSVQRLITVHSRVLSASAALAAAPQARVHGVAHDALLEVASLLAGRPPSGAEVGYVDARTDALEQLEVAINDPRARDGEADHRQAMVEARHEVEQLAGDSSLTEASRLSRELLGTDGE